PIYGTQDDAAFGCHATPITEIPLGAAGRGPESLGVRWLARCGGCRCDPIVFCAGRPDSFSTSAAGKCPVGRGATEPIKSRWGALVARDSPAAYVGRHGWPRPDLTGRERARSRTAPGCRADTRPISRLVTTLSPTGHSELSGCAACGSRRFA